MNPRVAASHILAEVLHHHGNLDSALAKHSSKCKKQDQAFVQALCYGVLREWPRPEFILKQLLHTPLKKDTDLLRCLLLCGIHELRCMQTAEYAAVSETVEACNELGAGWARGLINAILRNAQRKKDEFTAAFNTDPETQYAHPRWLLKQFQQDWPDHWQAIVNANNQQAPMMLRVNQRKRSRAELLALLQEKNIAATPAAYTDMGIILAQACDVQALPGFAKGEVSVQDAAAQRVIPIVDPQPGERILDACAAPGGKTCHLLEQQPQLRELVALDHNPQRLQRIQDNLDRLQLHATLLCGDAAQPHSWWDNEPFDRILLDAPCSASGVIRRHPDIKVLRQAQDIAALAQQQTQILTALWPLLKPGGMLIYTTCSVLVQENDAPLAQFHVHHPAATIVPIDAAWGHATAFGRQLLPGEDNMDGFYYACLRKTP
jgi:16S rRNA (cytosine967-C5)-methyltransferase